MPAGTAADCEDGDYFFEGVEPAEREALDE